MSNFKSGEELKRNVDGFCSVRKFLKNTALGAARALGTAEAVGGVASAGARV